MSFVLDEESLETISYERSKIWSNFLKNCEEVDDGVEIELTQLEEVFGEEDEHEDESADATMMDIEEAQEDVVEDDINNTTHCMTNAQLSQMLSSGSNKEILDQTMPIMEEHMRKWKEAGLDRILNTFDARKIEKHVGGWMRRNNSCYSVATSPSPKAYSKRYQNVEPNESDEDEEEQEKAAYYSCKRSSSRQCSQSPRSAIKMCRTLPLKRSKYVCQRNEEKERRHLQTLHHRREEHHRRQYERERELIYHTSPRHYSCSKAYELRKRRNVSRNFPTSSSSSDEELQHSPCDCASCDVTHSYYSSNYRRNYHSRSLRDYQRHERRFELESRSFSSNVYCKRNMRHQLHRQHAFEEDRRPRLKENNCGCCNSDRLCSKVVHIANSSTEEWVVENKSSPDALLFETPMKSTVRVKPLLKKSASCSKVPIKFRANEERLYETHKALKQSSNSKAAMKAKLKSVEEENPFDQHKALLTSNSQAKLKANKELQFEPHKTTIGSNSIAKFRGDEELLFEQYKPTIGSYPKSANKAKIKAVGETIEPPKLSSSSNSKTLMKSKLKSVEEEITLEQPNAILSSNSKAKLKADKELQFESHKTTIGSNSNAKLRADEELLFEQYKPTTTKSANKAKIKAVGEPVELNKLTSSSNSKTLMETKLKSVEEELTLEQPKAILSSNSKAKLTIDEELLFEPQDAAVSDTKSKKKTAVTFSNVDSMPSTPKSTKKPKALRTAKKKDQILTKDAPVSTRKPKSQTTSKKEKPQPSASKEVGSELPTTPEKPSVKTKAAKQKKIVTKSTKKATKSNRVEVNKNTEEADELSELDEELKRALVLSKETYVLECEKLQEQTVEKAKTESPQLPEQSMFNNHSVACNSTALTDVTACSRALKPQKTDVVKSAACINLCTPESSTVELDADNDCTMVTSTTTSCEAVAAAAVAAVERPQLKISKKGVLLYEPQKSTTHSINSNNSTANFTLTQHTLSPIIGKRRARKFFKYYTGSCSFDSRYYVYYCPPRKLLAAISSDCKSLDLDLSSGSGSECEDDFEIVDSIGLILTEIEVEQDNGGD